MDTYNEGEGWILKAPYVQNQVGFSVRTIKSTDEIDEILRRLYECTQSSTLKGFAPAEVFEYLILQPKMKKKNESKVILYNGTAKYITSTTTCGLLGSNDRSKETLCAFAEEAWEHLCVKTEGAFLSDGLTRVDIFCNNFGKLVVNEFESLDAQYSKKGKTSEADTKAFLESYYFDKIGSLVSAVIKSYN